MLNKYIYDGNVKEFHQMIQGRKQAINEEVTRSVQDIMKQVEKKGDKALLDYCAKFDNFRPTSNKDIVVKKQEIMDAVTRVGSNFIKILERTKEQLIAYHKHQSENSWMIQKENGIVLGSKITPLENVALYVPGGTATYPSTVMMNAIPSMLAGVKNMYILTPVKSDGKVSDVILAAAYVSGIETIYKVGGAQAIAAATFGTKLIVKADKIVGPGNIYVATAKKLAYGHVDIDMVAGPSEILIIADEKANPKYIASDLMSQSEHDKLASALLITTSEKLIDEVSLEIEKQIETLDRKEIIAYSLENYGGAILVDDLNQAFHISNELAPEHLEVLTENPFEKLSLIQNAGSIFLGEYSPEPLGDYMSGTNHVLPTGGTAKFYSALGVYDFVKRSCFSYYTKTALETFKDDVITFANKEGLKAHANSIRVRFEEEK